MSAKISKEDTDRSSSGCFLLAALERQGPHVASLLAGLAAPHRREDDPEPGFLGTVVALARRLEAAIERLTAAGNELYAADAALVVLRIRRDALTEQLARAIVRHSMAMCPKIGAPLSAVIRGALVGGDEELVMVLDGTP